MYCGYKNCGIVISTKKINHILDDKDVHYEAHCLVNTCDKRLKQYFTHIIELVGITCHQMTELKQEKYTI